MITDRHYDIHSGHYVFRIQEGNTHYWRYNSGEWVKLQYTYAPRPNTTVLELDPNEISRLESIYWQQIHES